jgi:cytochrome c553
MKSLAALILATAIAGPALASESKPAFKPDLARGQAVAATCQACHMADGSRGLAQNPILAGQHPEYIVKQLTEFKAGLRKNPIMQGFSALLSEEDMRHVAAFYGSKKPVTGEARDKETLALGERIYRGGIAARQVPACAGCHSPTGAGIPAQYPRIGGQHPEYTELQLTNFRAGERANSPQMMAIAGKLSDRELKAVSDYVAGLR